MAPETTTCPSKGCRAPAVVVDRWVLDSTDGPVEHAKVRCGARHVFCGAVSSLWPSR